MSDNGFSGFSFQNDCSLERLQDSYQLVETQALVLMIGETRKWISLAQAALGESRVQGIHEFTEWLIEAEALLDELSENIDRITEEVVESEEFQNPRFLACQLNSEDEEFSGLDDLLDDPPDPELMLDEEYTDDLAAVIETFTNLLEFWYDQIYERLSEIRDHLMDPSNAERIVAMAYT